MIYNVNGNYVISTYGTWLPGVYETKKAARFAYQFDYGDLLSLQKSLGAWNITMKNLIKLRESIKAPI